MDNEDPEGLSDVECLLLVAPGLTVGDAVLALNKMKQTCHDHLIVVEWLDRLRVCDAHTALQEVAAHMKLDVSDVDLAVNTFRQLCIDEDGQ